MSAIRFYRDPRGFQVFVGPWAARVSWSRTGCFANGSRWFTGWHRWREDADV